MICFSGTAGRLSKRMSKVCKCDWVLNAKDPRQSAKLVVGVSMNSSSTGLRGKFVLPAQAFVRADEYQKRSVDTKVFVILYLLFQFSFKDWKYLHWEGIMFFPLQILAESQFYQSFLTSVIFCTGTYSWFSCRIFQEENRLWINIVSCLNAGVQLFRFTKALSRKVA